MWIYFEGLSKLYLKGVVLALGVWKTSSRTLQGMIKIKGNPSPVLDIYSNSYYFKQGSPLNYIQGVICTREIEAYMLQCQKLYLNDSEGEGRVKVRERKRLSQAKQHKASLCLGLSLRSTILSQPVTRSNKRPSE